MYSFETGRLLMRIPEMADADMIFHHLQHPAISQTTLNIPYPYLLQDAKTWIMMNRKKMEDHSSATFVIILKETSQLIGAIGLELNHQHHRGEAGYWITESEWNKGYCTEALSGLIKFGFGELHLHKIYATHLLQNESSGRVMQKSGMKLEGTLIDHYLKKGKFVSVTQYSIINIKASAG